MLKTLWTHALIFDIIIVIEKRSWQSVSITLRVNGWDWLRMYTSGRWQLAFMSLECALFIKCLFLQPFLLLSISSSPRKQTAEDKFLRLRAKKEDNVCTDSSNRDWPKGGKADGISLTYGKLQHVTQPDQCPPSPPFASLRGTFNAQTCSC